MRAFLDDDTRKENTVLNDRASFHYYGVGKNGMLDITIDAAAVSKSGILDPCSLPYEVGRLDRVP